MSGGPYFVVVPGDPVPWARAGKSGKRHFTKAHVRQFQRRVRLAAFAAGVHPLEGPVELVVRTYWPRTKELERPSAPAGAIWKDTAPDWDNLGKLVSDALQPTRAEARMIARGTLRLEQLGGVAFATDGRVARGVVEDRYVARGGAPRTEVEIRAMDGA